jgi:putative transcriptional regulator
VTAQRGRCGIREKCAWERAAALPRLHNQIRRLRFEHGEMTQQELADRVAVTRQTIIALEADQYAPWLLLAFRIAKVFGVPVEALFQYEDPLPR